MPKNLPLLLKSSVVSCVSGFILFIYLFCGLSLWVQLGLHIVCIVPLSVQLPVTVNWVLYRIVTDVALCINSTIDNTKCSA
jgi:hypothetical protein